MKKVTLWGGLLIAVIVVAAVIAALQFGVRSPIIASGTVTLSPDLADDAKDVRTLFITVFDADSPVPMPYGAMRTTIDFDPEGKFFDFVLTPESLRVMNPNAALPGRLRIKARLDKDGMGGQDQPGDLTGEVSNVPLGSSDIELEITERISS